MSRTGSRPRITCPDCGRPVAVSRRTETVHRHDASPLSGLCAASGTTVSLYDQPETNSAHAKETSS